MLGLEAEPDPDEGGAVIPLYTTLARIRRVLQQIAGSVAVSAITALGEDHPGGGAARNGQIWLSCGVWLGRSDASATLGAKQHADAIAGREDDVASLHDCNRIPVG